MIDKLPDLGPIVVGGVSVLDQDLTHITSGLGWPAFDDGWVAGKAVLAPEDLTIDDDTSGAQGGDAFYARGDSGLRYWIGHITTVPRQGTRFARGAAMTRISADHRVPHVHLGIDARPLLGHHLASHDDYTHGSPTVRAQLEAALKPCKTTACMWAWIKWYRGREEYEPFGAKNPDVRPNVPKRIPLTWWARLVLNLGRG